MDVLMETVTGPALRDHLKEVCNKMGLNCVFRDEVSDITKYRAVLVGHQKLKLIPDLISSMPRLEMIQTLSAGVDTLDFRPIPGKIILCSNAGAYSEPIAEHVFAMIFDLSKSLTKNHIRMQSGIFDQQTSNRRIAGKKIGIIGYGGIGRAVGKLAKKLDMKVLAVSRSGSRTDEEFYGDMSQLDKVLAESDIILISLPLSKHTRGIIDSRRLGMMKKNAILINVARAEIINQEDLYNHLVRNPDFRAGIDVWWKEPMKDSKFETAYPFLQLENFVGSPHNSGIAEGEVAFSYEYALRNIARFAQNEKVENVVNRSDYL